MTYLLVRYKRPLLSPEGIPLELQLIGRWITGRPKAQGIRRELPFVNEPLGPFIRRPLNSLFIHDGCTDLQGRGFEAGWSRGALLVGEEDPALEDVCGGECPSILPFQPSQSAAHPERSVPVISEGGWSITYDGLIHSAGVVKYRVLV